MEGRRQTTRRRGDAAQKKKLWLLLGAAAAVILVVALIVCLTGKGKDKDGESGKETPNQQTQQPKKEETSDTPQETPAKDPKTEEPKQEEPQTEQNSNSSSSQSGAASSVSSEQVDGKWNLLLVNPWNPIPDGFSVELEYLDNGAVDKRCYPQLQQMMDDCRAEGLSPYICSSFRTQELQQELFDNQIAVFRGQGYDEDEARRLAAREVAVPGTSEHQLGLAVDIIDTSNWNLDESQEHTAAQQWLMANSWRYGFILRYPNSKRDITGIIYEPWHYRYVGYDVAKEIHERGICLEEYLGRASH